MGRCHQSGTPIDRQARVAGVVDDHRFVGVKPDARAQRTCSAPCLGRQRLLERGGGADGIAGGCKRGRHSVAHPREHVAPMGRDRLLQEFVVANHGGLHRVGILLPEAR